MLQYHLVCLCLEEGEGMADAHPYKDLANLDLTTPFILHSNHARTSNSTHPRDPTWKPLGLTPPMSLPGALEQPLACLIA
jgi:hypothetical protein